MAGIKIGAAIFDTALDLTGLKRGLQQAEAEFARASARIRRLGPGEKAFSYVRPFRLNAAAIKEFNTQATAASAVTNRLAGSMAGLALKYVASGAAIYGLSRALSDATQAAMEFEVAMANIDTLAANTAEQMKVLADRVLNLGGEVGEAPKSLARALYDIVSAGFGGSDALRVLEASAKAARAGLTDTRTAADAVTTALNAYGLAATEATHVTDVLQTTVKYGKTTWDKLAPTIGTVIPLAAAAGVSLEELGGSLAILTANGVETALAVTQVRSLISGLIQGTDQAKEVMKTYGFSIGAATLRQKGLVETLRELKDAIHGDLDALFKFLGRIEAVNAALALTAEDAFPKLVSIIDEMKKASGVVDEAFNKQIRTAQGQIDIFKSKLAALKIELGNELLPVIGEVAAALGGLVDAIRSLMHPNLGEARRILKEAGVEFGGGLDVALARQLDAVKKTESALKALKNTMENLGSTNLSRGHAARFLEGIAESAGVGKEKIDEFHKAFMAAFRSSDVKAAEDTLRSFGSYLEKLLSDQLNERKTSIKNIINTPELDKAKAEIKAIQSALAQARTTAYSVGSAELFKAAVDDAIKRLEALKERLKDNAEFVKQVDELIKNLQQQKATFRINLKREDTDPILEEIKQLTEQQKNIVLRVNVLGGDAGAGVERLKKLRAAAEDLLKQSKSLAQQNAVLNFIRNLDNDIRSLGGSVQNTSSEFEDWLKKLQIRAKLQPELIVDTIGQLREVRARLVSQIRDIGPIDTEEKLQLLFTLDARIEKLDNVIEQLEGNRERFANEVEMYQEYANSRLEALGLELGKAANGAMRELMRALSGEVDYSQALEAASRLREILGNEWLKLPEEIRKAADKLLEEYDRVGNEIAKAQQHIAELIEQRRYGDGFKRLADDLRRSFATVGDALIYLIKNGTTDKQYIEALSQAFGEQGQAIADAFDNFQRLGNALRVGAISQDEYNRRVEEAKQLLSTLIKQTDQGSEAFNVLAELLLNTAGAAERTAGSFERLGEATGKSLISAQKAAAIFKATGGTASELFAAFTSDAQLSQDEAIALAKVFGTAGAAFAQLGGGLNVLDAQLTAGVITQEEYRKRLEQARDTLLQLAQRYAEDPRLIAFYAAALSEVQRELERIADSSVEAASKMLPEEMQRRAAALANEYEKLSEAVAKLIKDGKLSEREAKILAEAYGEQADAVIEVLNGMRLWRTQLDLGQITQEEFTDKVRSVIPVLEEALSKVETGSAAWFILAEAIKAAKDAIGKPTKADIPLPDQIAKDVGVIKAKGGAGLYGSGLDQLYNELQDIESTLRSKIAQAIADGMDPSNPEIQEAIEKLKSTQLELTIVAAAVNIRDSLIEAGQNIGSALADYLVNGGTDAAERLHDAIVSAGKSVGETLRKQLANVGAKVGADIGKEVGGQAGAAIGGTLGSALGPLGAALGAILGYFLGDLIGGWLGGLIDMLTGANQPKEPVNVPDQRVTTSVSEVNYNAVANVYYEAGADLNDPQTRAELRAFIRETATDLLQQLGLVRGGVSA